MPILNNLKSLIQLPGAYLNSRQAATQATQVQALANAAQNRQPTPKPQAMGPAVPPPSVSPRPQAPAPAPQPNPQIDALRSALGGFATGLQDFSKNLPQALNNANAAPPVDAFKPIEDEITANTAESPEEQDIKRKLANLIASKNLGLINAEEQAIPLQAILGEQGRIERRAGVEQQTLADRLTSIQAQRQGRLDVAKTRYGIEKDRYERTRPDEDKVADFVNEQGEQVVAFRNKQTGAVRNEVIGKPQGKPPTQTDRDRELKTKAIGVARPLLIGARGTDGYVNPQTYLKLRNDYAEAIGDPRDFDSTFAPMLSPAERRRLGVGTSYNPQQAANDIGSVLASYLGGS